MKEEENEGRTINKVTLYRIRPLAHLAQYSDWQQVPSVSVDASPPLLTEKFFKWRLQVKVTAEGDSWSDEWEDTLKILIHFAVIRPLCTRNHPIIESVTCRNFRIKLKQELQNLLSIQFCVLSCSLCI